METVILFGIKLATALIGLVRSLLSPAKAKAPKLEVSVDVHSQELVSVARLEVTLSASSSAESSVLIKNVKLGMFANIDDGPQRMLCPTLGPNLTPAQSTLNANNSSASWTMTIDHKQALAEMSNLEHSLAVSAYGAQGAVAVLQAIQSAPRGSFRAVTGEGRKHRFARLARAIDDPGLGMFFTFDATKPIGRVDSPKFLVPQRSLRTRIDRLAKGRAI